MPVTPSSSITRDDLQALATLANAKLAPGTPYSFNAFAGSDKIALPAQITATLAYGGAGAFLDGTKVTLYLYAYKTIDGVKTYTWIPVLKAASGSPGSGAFSVTWDWSSSTLPEDTKPDGFVAVIARPEALGSWSYQWRDLGNVTTFTETGAFNPAQWTHDISVDAAGQAVQMPCGHGIWLKTLNTIRKDFFAGLDLFGGSKYVFDADTMCVSGPWVVSQADKCYLYLGTAMRGAVLKDLAFLYSEADSIDGNELAPEADVSAFFQPVNGANNFNFGVKGTLNGRIVICSQPNAQSAADWTVSTTPASGITYTFDNNYFRTDLGTHVTGLIFDFVDVPYEVGTPIVLTVTPAAGHSVMPVANGAIADIVFTAEKVTYDTTDAIAIHTAGAAAKSAALPSSLPALTVNFPLATTNYECHHRSFCNGVFIANTLPTVGVMTYLDVDLPQYSPSTDLGHAPSTRRTARNEALPYQPLVDNRGALWPIFRNSDFTPDSVAGRPINGSKAWQLLATKYVDRTTFTDDIFPGGEDHTLFNYSISVPTGTEDVRFYTDNPEVTLYAKAGSAPTVEDYDASAPGGTWLSLKDALGAFATNTDWFYAILNPTPQTLTGVTTTALVIENGTAPNGTFFPTFLDDDGLPVAELEGTSYLFDNPTSQLKPRPIPLSGYCIYQISVQFPSGASSPNSINVNIGLRKDFGFDSAGTFDVLDTITIPAGQSAATLETFLPVLVGTPLTAQLAGPPPSDIGSLFIRASVNFQPMIHTTFTGKTALNHGLPRLAGYYNGPLIFDPQKALIFFRDGFNTAPIQLPVPAALYEDLTNLLNNL